MIALVARLQRDYDRAIRAEENAPTLRQAWKLAAASDLCLRRLRAAQAGQPIPMPRPAPATRVNRAKAALATLGAIGGAIGRAIRAAAALAKAQAVAAARRAARAGRQALRNAVLFVVRNILQGVPSMEIKRRYLAVVTFVDGSRALVEYTGHRQEARKWLARSGRWASSFVVDTLGANIADVRPAYPSDLPRFRFTLPVGQVQA